MAFHDATRKEHMRLRPDSPATMLGIHGVGQAKLERYGEAFQAVLAEHPTSGTGPPDRPGRHGIGKRSFADSNGWPALHGSFTARERPLG